MTDKKKSVSEEMQDELEPIIHPSPDYFDESDEIESIKEANLKKKSLHERGWHFNMEKGPGVEF
jgi:hypothetical protein